MSSSGSSSAGGHIPESRAVAFPVLLLLTLPFETEGDQSSHDCRGRGGFTDRGPPNKRVEAGRQSDRDAPLGDTDVGRHASKSQAGSRGAYVAR